MGITDPHGLGQGAAVAFIGKLVFPPLPRPAEGVSTKQCQSKLQIGH